MNTCDLLWLWRLCCVCSAHDLFHDHTEESANKTFVNFSRTRALMELVLESTSTYTKSGSLGPEELRRIFDDTVDLMDDEGALAELMASNRTSRAKWEFTRFMVRLSSTQISDQDHGFGRDAGRLIAFWEELPTDETNYIPRLQRKRVLDVTRRIPEVLGTSITNLTLVAFLVHHFYQGKYRKISGVFPDIPRKGSEKEGLRTQKLRSLLETLEGLSYQDDWDFNQQDLMGVWPIEGQKLNAYIELFSKDARELRDLSKSDKLLKTGHFSRELSALDCFPLVALENGCFIAPNIRLILRSFASGIDFTLLDALGDEYSHARGALQEAYLHRLIEESLDEVEIIPERAYGKESGEALT